MCVSASFYKKNCSQLSPTQRMCLKCTQQGDYETNGNQENEKWFLRGAFAAPPLLCPRCQQRFRLLHAKPTLDLGHFKQIKSSAIHAAWRRKQKKYSKFRSAEFCNEMMIKDQRCQVAR